MSCKIIKYLRDTEISNLDIKQYNKEYILLKLETLNNYKNQLIHTITNVYPKELQSVIAYAKNNKVTGTTLITKFQHNIIYNYLLKLYSTQQLIEELVGHDDNFIKLNGFQDMKYEIL